MDNFTNTMIIVFTLLAVWYLWQIVIQFKEIKISCRFMDMLKGLIAVIFAFMAIIFCVDLINQKASTLTLILTLFLCLLLFQREGIGNRGFISKGIFVPYLDVKKYDITKDEKNVKVSFVYKETIRKDKKEGEAELIFDISKESDIHKLLDNKFSKKAVKNRRAKNY